MSRWPDGRARSSISLSLVVHDKDGIGGVERTFGQHMASRPPAIGALRRPRALSNHIGDAEPLGQSRT